MKVLILGVNGFIGSHYGAPSAIARRAGAGAQD